MLDPVIHQRTRLRIMTVLYRNRQLPYTAVRDALELTDGNLASHAARLEEAGYLRQQRVLLGREGFQLRYFLTEEGEQAFRAYLRELRGLLRTAEERTAGPGHGEERTAGPGHGEEGATGPGHGEERAAEDDRGPAGDPSPA